MNTFIYKIRLKSDYSIIETVVQPDLTERSRKSCVFLIERTALQQKDTHVGDAGSHEFRFWPRIPTICTPTVRA